jgi:hypothetical protein
MRKAGLSLMAGLAAFASFGAGIATPDSASAAVKRAAAPTVHRATARTAVHVNTAKRTVSSKATHRNTASTTHRNTASTTRRVSNVSRVTRTTSVNRTNRHTTTSHTRLPTHVTHTTDTKRLQPVKPRGHSVAVTAAVGAVGAAALMHGHSKFTKPAHVQHNPKHMVGHLGNQFNHKPVLFSKHGHFFRRHYYSMLIGGVLSWFWYDDAIYDYDPIIPTLVSVPVCLNDDTDDCEARPLASVQRVAYRPPPAPVAGACELAVFWEPNFAGERLLAKQDVPYVGDQWNDHVTSIEIKSGAWEFYQDPEYGGDMIKMVAGPYPRLEDNWTGRISSFRCVK